MWEQFGYLGEQVTPVGVSWVDDGTIQVGELLFLVWVVKTRAGDINYKATFRFVGGSYNVSGGGIEW